MGPFRSAWVCCVDFSEDSLRLSTRDYQTIDRFQVVANRFSGPFLFHSVSSIAYVIDMDGKPNLSDPIVGPATALPSPPSHATHYPVSQETDVGIFMATCSTELDIGLLTLLSKDVDPVLSVRCSI